MIPSNQVTIQLPGGPILVQNDGNLIRARGVRYAQADKRFEKPRAVSTWTEIQDCTKPASVCPQNTSRLALVTGILEENNIQDEDCLHVSIYAPASAQAAPVMVFLHGGAYVTGGGDVDAYCPHGLASEGVVAVTVTHRLGIFGYLPIPNIAPANLGLLDQIEALKWIQGNIHAFGGDPANVTLFGQSAGADAIYCLLVAEGTSELFHRAILQSLPLGRLHDKNRHHMTEAMSQCAANSLSAAHLQTGPVSSLLELQAKIQKVARSVSSALVTFAPLFNEYPLPPETSLFGRFISAVRQKPIFIGYTSNEETAFKHIDSSEEATKYFYELFQGASNMLHRQTAEALGYEPPIYEFHWYPEGNNNLLATHCMELPFLLGNWSAWKDAPMLQGTDAQRVVETVGSAVKNLWIAFSRGADLTNRKFIIDENFRFVR